MDSPDAQTSAIVGIALKLAGVFASFVAGIVAATWSIARKIQRYDDTMHELREFQQSCPGQKFDKDAIAKLDQKLDYIIQEGLPAVHARIDSSLLAGKAGNERG